MKFQIFWIFQVFQLFRHPEKSQNSAYSSFEVNIFLKAAKCSTLAQGNKGEVNELRTIVQNYENIIDYVNKSYTEKLLQKVNAKCDVEIQSENNSNFKDKELNSTVADRDALQGCGIYFDDFDNFVERKKN